MIFLVVTIVLLVSTTTVRRCNSGAILSRSVTTEDFNRQGDSETGPKTQEECVTIEMSLESRKLSANNPLKFKILIMNDSQQDCQVLDKIILGYNLVIEIVDEEMKPYLYQGWNAKYEFPIPDSSNDFVLLRPGHIFGVYSYVGNDVVIDESGIYKVRARYYCLSVDASSTALYSDWVPVRVD